MSTGFARDYLMNRIVGDLRQRKGRQSPACAWMVIGPTTGRLRLDRPAQPDQVPGRLLPPSCGGSYDLQASHVKVKAGLHEQGPGRGSPTAGSFRITEAVYLVERMVDALSERDEGRPDRPCA